jgi:hypothetical protein
MFGQISNRTSRPTPTWHVLKPDGNGWRTACTAQSARPGLTVIAIAPEPGPVQCKLKRCQVAIEDWKSSHSMV